MMPLVDAEKVKPTVILLIDVRKSIWPVKLCTTPKPLVKLSKGQPVNPGLPGNGR